MIELVDPTEIEEIVGTRRHKTYHLARAVSAEETVYIMHSQVCVDTGRDLRDCPFSLALYRGIPVWLWNGKLDRVVTLFIDNTTGLLKPFLYA